MFVVLHLLNGKHLIETLRYRYLTDKELTLLIQAAGIKVPEEFMQPPPSTSHKKKEFVTILQAHDDYVKEQEWTLHMKSTRSAKCTFSGCKINIPREKECFLVNGALTVPYNSNKAVEEVPFRIWTNIKQPACFQFQDVERDRAEEISKQLQFPISVN